MPNNENHEQDDEEKTIQLILESLHTLKRLSDLHHKKLQELTNNSASLPDTTRTVIQEETIVADTITKLADNSLRGYTDYLNRYYA